MENPFSPPGGHPPQSQLLSGRALFTEAYAVLPKGTMQDIVTSNLPHWRETRAWILARPLSGFAETFAQYLMEVAPGGGTDIPEPDANAEAVLYVLGGTGKLVFGGEIYTLAPGSYAYLPPGTAWQLENTGAEPLTFHWIRKAYVQAKDIAPPAPFVMTEAEAATVAMPGTDGAWTTTRFVDSGDMAHDMHVNIVSFEPGASIPFLETHVMEHGIYILEGKAVYRLNRDWVEVEAGDFLWLRAFCPQACYAGGPGRFRYLLYKDVNRHPSLTL